MKRTTRRARWDTQVFNIRFDSFQKDLDDLCSVNANDPVVNEFKEIVIDDLDDLIDRLKKIKEMVEEA